MRSWTRRSTNYAAQRGYLSETSRQNREEQIVNREKEIKKISAGRFRSRRRADEKRIELIKPIQERVFAAINKYAETNNLGMVVDRANNQTLLYYQPALDKTDEIIKMLNNN